MTGASPCRDGRYSVSAGPVSLTGLRGRMAEERQERRGGDRKDEHAEEYPDERPLHLLSSIQLYDGRLNIER